MARRALELVALLLLITAVALAAVIVGRGTRTVTKPVVQAVAPQQAPAAAVVMRSNASTSLKEQDTLSCPPPPGQGVPGACAPKPVQVLGATTAAKTPSVSPVKVDPPACVPDVSSWQGYHVDWGAVKRWQLSRGCTPAGIFKIGEYIDDPTAATNNAGLKANGMVRMGYWFIRNTGCIHEADQIRDEAKNLGLTTVWLDDEVSEGRNYTGAGCITPTLKAAGITAVGIYASPGAFPGGSTQPLAAWIAAYGPLNPPNAPWGGPIKGFQCTDGVFGCKTYVPGIGYGDVSVDYGMTGLGQPKVPLCSRTMCLSKFTATRWVNHAKGARYCTHGCVERQYVNWWQGAQHSTHAQRLALRYRIQAQAVHLAALIKRSPPADNVKNNRGIRLKVLDEIGYHAAYFTTLNAYRKAR